MQANQVREKPPKRSSRRIVQTTAASESNGRKCPFCSAAIQESAAICPSCGRPLESENPGWVSLKDALLFGAVLLLVALAIAPIWPKDQIYGKSILFLVNLGVGIPTNTAEAAAFRHQMMNVVQIYQGFNLLHYVLISAFLFLHVIHLVQVSRQATGYGSRVWVLLGLLLLVFPAVNLVLSRSMFLSPGVLGTALAAIFIVMAARFLR